MLATKSIDVRDNFKAWCDRVTGGETVLVIRPKNENIYMMNEAEYNELQKARHNAEYLAMLDRGFNEIDNGSKGITKTMEELRAMEHE